MYNHFKNEGLQKTEDQINGDIFPGKVMQVIKQGPVNIQKNRVWELENRSMDLKARCYNLLSNAKGSNAHKDPMPGDNQLKPSQEQDLKDCIQELLALNKDTLQGLNASQERERAYQTLINSTEELILLLDDSGKIVVANEAFMQAFNLKSEVVQEQKLTNLVPHIARACRDQIEVLKKSCQESFFQCWHGDELYEVKIYPVYDPEGTLLYRTLFSNNVTKKNREAEALNNSKRRLQELSLNIFDTLESERKRIAQDLHDHVGQSMGAVKYSIESLLQQYHELFSTSQEQHLSAVIKWIQVTIKELMRIIFDLRPPMLDELGFRHTVGWFCRQYDEFYPDLEVQSEINLHGQDIEEPVKTILFRVIQEAFNNTVNHSQGTLLRLYVGREKDWVQFKVTDNGIGFDPQEVLAGSIKPGFGLLSIKERIAKLGGHVEFNSSPHKGVVIQGCLPEDSTASSKQDSKP